MNDYIILERCGEGTYGQIYKAIHKETGSIVALKQVTNVAKEDGTPVEVKYLIHLKNSSNIVHLRDYFYSADNNLFLVMEFISRDLWRIISNPNYILNLGQIKYITKQILESIYQCHSKGVMHRDIKPANLLIENDGKLKLTDFGLSTFIRKTTTEQQQQQLSSNVVSLYYRPPELLLGSTCYGGEIDVWSTGCILMEMVNNCYLFAGSNETDQLELIFKSFGIPSEQQWPGIGFYPNSKWITRFPQYHRRTLVDLFPRLQFIPHLLDLASQMLELNPKIRINAFNALCHPWFISSESSCLDHLVPSSKTFVEDCMKISSRATSSMTLSPSSHCLRSRSISPPTTPIARQVPFSLSFQPSSNAVQHQVPQTVLYNNNSSTNNTNHNNHYNNNNNNIYQSTLSSSISSSSSGNLVIPHETNHQYYINFTKPDKNHFNNSNTSSSVSNNLPKNHYNEQSHNQKNSNFEFVYYTVDSFQNNQSHLSPKISLAKNKSPSHFIYLQPKEQITQQPQEIPQIKLPTSNQIPIPKAEDNTAIYSSNSYQQTPTFYGQNNTALVEENSYNTTTAAVTNSSNNNNSSHQNYYYLYDMSSEESDSESDYEQEMHGNDTSNNNHNQNNTYYIYNSSTVNNNNNHYQQVHQNHHTVDQTILPNIEHFNFNQQQLHHPVVPNHLQYCHTVPSATVMATPSIISTTILQTQSSNSNAISHQTQPLFFTLYPQYINSADYSNNSATNMVAPQTSATPAALYPQIPLFQIPTTSIVPSYPPNHPPLHHHHQYTSNNNNNNGFGNNNLKCYPSSSSTSSSVNNLNTGTTQSYYGFYQPGSHSQNPIIIN